MNFNEKSSEKGYFLFFSAIAIFIYIFLAIALPSWNWLAAHYDWVSLIQPLNLHKLKLFLKLGILISLIQLGLLLATVSRQKLKHFLLVFCSSILLMALTYLSLYAHLDELDKQKKSDMNALKNIKEKLKQSQRFQMNFDLIKVMKIKNLASIEDKPIFDKKFILQANIKTYDDFYHFAEKRFAENKAFLKRKWNIKNNELLKTLFFMNLVSNMWGYGNRIDVHKSGCVQANEDTMHRTIPPEQITIDTFIKTDIGCCTDSAYLMQYLLTKSQIKNRLVLNPGHIFNEAFIKGKWMAFDATSNIWWHSSWESIQQSDRRQPFSVTLFPHNNTVYKSPYYREVMGSFQVYLLLEAVYKKATDIKYPEYYRPLPPF